MVEVEVSSFLVDEAVCAAADFVASAVGRLTASVSSLSVLITC